MARTAVICPSQIMRAPWYQLILGKMKMQDLMTAGQPTSWKLETFTPYNDAMAGMIQDKPLRKRRRLW